VNSTSNFASAKELFVDENRNFADSDNEYILIDGVKEAYKKLLHAVEKPLKIILLYGYPGSGKTAMLHRLCANIKREDGQKVLHYPTPTFMRLEELVRIFKTNSRKRVAAEPTFFELMELFGATFKKDTFLVFLDEAQLYDDKEMEYIRLLSDTKIFKFVVALHKIDEEHLIAKAHFQSRIWESVELNPLTIDEFRFFIERKLLSKELNQTLSMFSAKNYKLMHKFTQGNIRESMKFMYKLFDFHEFLEKEKPSELNYKEFKTKHIEMVAIDSGYINV